MDGPTTAPEATVQAEPAPWGSSDAAGEIDASRAPIMTLRGAGVDADGRRVGRVVIAVGLVALAVLALVLFVAGAQKNAQISRLRQSGVAVDATVTGCLGLMGGSGSNLVGYDCRGTFTLAGHRYKEALAGNSLHSPGATIRILTVPGDPSLVSTAAILATERPTWKVFVLPTSLLLILGLLVTALVVRRRRQPRMSTARNSSVTAQ